MKPHRWLAVAGVFGAIGVTIGAFGAHALPDYLSGQGFDEANIAGRLDTFDTGARYHMYAAFALLAVGLGGHLRPARAWSVAGWLLLVGGVMFSHSLYGLAMTEGWRWLGPVTPLGGLLTILGWAAITVAAFARGGGSDSN